MGLPKNELITKLEAISVLHNKALSIKSKMNNFTPEDNYERKVKVPLFPGEYENDEERENLESAVEHEDEDAIEQIGQEYDTYYCPREPHKPDVGNQPGPETPLTDEFKKKKSPFLFVAAFVAICSLISGGLFSGNALTVILNLAIIAACVITIFILYKKMKELKKADEEGTKLAIEIYEHRKKEQEQKYEQDMKEYQSLMTSYKLLRADFIEEYTKWREIYLESLKEEAQIEEKLEADRVAAVKKIEDEEFNPVLEDMAELNDLITTEYLPALEIIIDLLKSGRADDLKEAINLYEDIVYRERQLQLQREQEEHRRYEEAMKREAEERHHREQMEFQEKQERQRRYEEKERQRKEDEIRAREKEEGEKAANRAKAEAKSRCHWCTNYRNCSVRHNPPLNCTGFRPGNTHQI